MQLRGVNMSKMTTCLWFDHGKAREAAEFYASVFPDSQVGEGHASAADNPSAKEGEELIVEFTVLGQAFIGLNGGPNFKPNEAVSFMILTENQEETDRYWNAIVGNGGEESPWPEGTFPLPLTTRRQPRRVLSWNNSTGGPLDQPGRQGLVFRVWD